jgi:biopolymer transport protein ExbD
MPAPSFMLKHHGKAEAPMPLASMMDMMTIILLFLLKSYSTTGVLVTQVDSMDLPSSTVKTNPHEALSIVVDSGALSQIPGVYIEENGARQDILDEGSTLFSLATGAAALDPDAMILRGLESFLKEKAADARELESQYGVPFEGQITIQADPFVPYNSILKVLATCGSVGYNMTEFVVIKKD